MSWLIVDADVLHYFLFAFPQKTQSMYRQNACRPLKSYHSAAHYRRPLLTQILVLKMPTISTQIPTPTRAPPSFAIKLLLGFHLPGQPQLQPHLLTRAMDD
jgi:hypothetical protein